MIGPSYTPPPPPAGRTRPLHQGRRRWALFTERLLPRTIAAAHTHTAGRAEDGAGAAAPAHHSTELDSGDRAGDGDGHKAGIRDETAGIRTGTGAGAGEGYGMKQQG